MAEIREEKPTTFFESIEFIFHHPWLFVAPFVIIMSVTMAQTANAPLKYRSYGVVSFEKVGKITKEDEIELDALFKKLLLGKNADIVIRKVWPEKKAESYGSARSLLREQVRLIPDKDGNLLSITFDSTDPETCYKVVLEVIDRVRHELRESAQKKLTTGLDFLENQETYYRNKVKELDEELSRIRSELKSKSSELSDEERILISEITGDADLAFRDRTTLQKLAQYDEMQAQLQLQLLEKEKRKKALLDSLETGEYRGVITGTTAGGDTYIEQYSRLLAQKELEIANLLSQGYLPEHPKIRSIKNEIEAVKALRDKRMKTVGEERESMLEVEGKRQAEERIKVELDNIELEIETLEDKIGLLQEKYKQAAPGVGLQEADALSLLASRFKELKSEKDINQRYYYEMKRQLEEAKMKSRIEESEAGMSMVIIENPILPVTPIPFQKTPKIIWGFMLSLFIGTGLAYTADSLDNSVKSAAELRELLHTPILGSVDKISNVQEIRLKVFRRNVIFFSLLGFALFAKVLLKFKLFQIIFSFLK